jgi:hypothetical protein
MILQVKLDLPDSLAREASMLGLLEPQTRHNLLREVERAEHNGKNDG